MTLSEVRLSDEVFTRENLQDVQEVWRFASLAEFIVVSLTSSEKEKSSEGTTVHSGYITEVITRDDNSFPRVKRNYKWINK